MTLKILLLFLCTLAGLVHNDARAQDRSALAKSLLDSAKRYEAQNKNLRAYEFCKKAQSILSSLPSTPAEDLARAESDLGTYAYRMGNVSLSETHHRRAIEIVLSMRNPSYECLYLSGNNMGSIMWFASKIDSAVYYFNMALDAVSRMDSTPMNRYYRPAVLNNNLAAIYGQQGKTTEGIAAMKTTIQNLRLFLAVKDSGLKKDNAMHFQFEAIDNLAGIYKGLGNYRKARDLLTHSYEQKQKALDRNDPDIFKSEILLGQLYRDMKENNKAEQFLLKGLNGMATADGDFLFWQADAYSTLSLLNEERNNKQQAAVYYELADSLYEASLNGSYDDIYLEFLGHAARFYAKNHQPAIALSRAMKGYNYVIATEGRGTLPEFYQLLNLSEVYFASGDYQSALKYGKQGLQTVNDIISSGKNFLDSIKIELKKPDALLLIAKCEYELTAKKNQAALTPILRRLQEAQAILERRKSIMMDEKDIALLMASQQELLDFHKKLVAELYNTSGSPSYIDQLVTLHESGLYNRIRSRLDQETEISFAHVPEKTLATEKRLRTALNDATSATGGHGVVMRQYLQAEKEWDQFLEKLRISYPVYYKMRYASIFKSMGEIMQGIPSGATVIRFMFAGDHLMALVADKDHRRLIRLDAAGLNTDIQRLSQFAMDAGPLGETLAKLFDKLWRPLIPEIRHNKVIIIPDGKLFNLNFEILSPNNIKDFSELLTGSILSTYTISYHYSLFLLGDHSDNIVFDKKFVAFTPGFSDRAKEEYKKNLDTAAEIDNFYLSLLPQPFTLNLVAKTVREFGGDIFTDEKSTVNSFRQYASGHSIIHIGTHAEADNLHPRFSRLVFSKDAASDYQDNYLYLFDIYDCNLQSNLTVLTACESGKAGYEDGEGMVSLAHAFNYAGSKSILMGLWKIDEQACATLIESFYKNLAKGMAKDEALRQAKFTYLKKGEGRVLAPQYWAGLVVMGNTSALELTTPASHFSYLFIVVGVLLAIAGLIFLARRTRKGALPNFRRGASARSGRPTERR